MKLVVNNTLPVPVRSMPRRGKYKDVRSREWLTPDEVERLANAAKKRGRYGARDAFIIRFAAQHGFRATELCELKWDLVLLESGRMVVERLKNGIESTHFLLGSEIRALRKLKREQPEGAVFVLETERKAPFTRDALARIIEKAGVAAGFNFPVHFHQLRHACGYRLANE